MLWFFKKKESDPDAEAFELYRTDFGIFQPRRFPDHREESFACRLKHRALVFEILKKNHFAWIPSDQHQYRDFYLEANVSFADTNGHSACGFIFRFVNNENFYYFLISDNGMFRLDVLFNGHPLKLIEWTPSPYIRAEECELRIIAHGGHFSFYAGNEWIAEIDDEKLSSGKIGIAGQNYDETELATFRITHLLLESRPLEVERAFYRWTRYIPVELSSRLTLARTLLAMGNYTAAAVEVKKVLKHDESNQDALMLFALATVNLKVYDQALWALEKLLSLNPQHREAVFEKANVLYLSNEFLKARDFLRSVIADFPEASTLWNLLGNCEHALGNWKNACAAYREAAEQEPTVSLFFINHARMLEKSGRPEEALCAYLKAAHILFREEAYDDLSLIMPRITCLDHGNAEVLGFEAKMLFHENKRNEAKPLLEKLVGENTADSAHHSLLALVLIDEGKREEALAHLEKAALLEPGYTLYWWRLAESKRLLGKDYSEELEKAFGLGPDDPWVNNLYGLFYSDKGEFERALPFLVKAHEKAGNDVDIIINLSKALLNLGRTDESRSLIEEALALHDDARLYNHRGNCAAREHDYGRAVAEYEKALKLAPDNPLFLENCAASCIEADMITRAEELLVKLLDRRPSSSVYNLLGNLSVIRMEYLRAELCYNEALLLSPESGEIALNLAALSMERSQYVKAKELIARVLKKEGTNARALLVREELRKRFEIPIHCALCGREWWVWRDIPAREVGKIHGEPPKESPAGKCPQCGKVYCIACAEEHLKNKRFVCRTCGKALKLSDNYLKHLVVEYLALQNREEQN
jgi:tetratricopeptide (TPR) repeat protein